MAQMEIYVGITTLKHSFSYEMRFQQIEKTLCPFVSSSAAFTRICPESLSIASIPYAQKHSHIAWQKVGLYQEERSKSLEKTHGPLCCCSNSPSVF